MQYLKIIIFCMFFSAAAVNAQGNPDILGIKLGMTVEQLNNRFQQIFEQTGRNFRISQYYTGEGSGASISTYDLQQFNEEQNMIYDAGTFGMMGAISNDLHIGIEPLGHDIDLCRSLGDRNLRRIKPNRYYVVKSENNAAVMLLGLSGNELVEIVVSPLLFNWTTADPQAIVNMLANNWKIKFKQRKQIPGYSSPIVVWDSIFAENCVVSVHSLRIVAIGKIVNTKKQTPSMDLNSNSYTFYKCLCNNNPSNQNRIPTYQNPGNSSKSGNFAPDANIPANQGYGQKNFNSGNHNNFQNQNNPCPHCKGSKYSSAYIEAPQYTSETNYQWCNICCRKVRAHTHKICPVCNGLGYK